LFCKFYLNQSLEWTECWNKNERTSKNSECLLLIYSTRGVTIRSSKSSFFRTKRKKNWSDFLLLLLWFILWLISFDLIKVVKTLFNLQVINLNNLRVDDMQDIVDFTLECSYIYHRLVITMKNVYLLIFIHFHQAWNLIA
jgi:hypothetical protein